MVAQGTRDTAPELVLRSALHRAGLRFRKNVVMRLERPGQRPVRREVDVVFPTERVAVFVDGCFWHDCPRHGPDVRHNSGWWREKLERNVARDEETNRLLLRDGWVTIRVWEHERPDEAAARVAAAVGIVRARRRTAAILGEC
jgi:DNA mismatch endonuclease (patch repair protein)